MTSNLFATALQRTILALAALSATTLTSSPAQAQTVAPAVVVESPARDLYDQATFYLRLNYYGFATTDLEVLDAKYSEALSVACGPNPQCPFETATPIIALLTKELGDEHTNLYTPAQFQQFNAQVAGGANTPTPIAGFQLLPVVNRQAARVFEVLPGTAADEAGFKRGDLILSFNGTPFGVTPETFSVAHRAAVSGGSPMQYEVERGGQKLSLTLTGRVYRNSSLPWLVELSPNTVRMVVPSFINPQTGATIHQLVFEAQRKNYTTMILDLRNNGGGLATECLSGVGAFVGDVQRLRQSKTGERLDGYRSDGVVYTGNVSGSERQTIYAIAQPARWTGKLAVITNANSGSCAEYFPSDIQFAKRAPVVGEATVGVGNTGTRIFALVNGGGYQITVQRSVRVDGTPYPAKNVPDIAVVDDVALFTQSATDNPLAAAIQAAR